MYIKMHIHIYNIYTYIHHLVANDVHKQILENTRVYRKIKANTRKHLTNDNTTSRNAWMFGKCLCFAQSGYHHLIPRERSCQNHRANLQDDKWKFNVEPKYSQTVWKLYNHLESTRFQIACSCISSKTTQLVDTLVELVQLKTKVCQH